MDQQARTMPKRPRQLNFLFAVILIAAAKASIPVNSIYPKSEEVFTPHCKGAIIHGTGFNQEATIMTFNYDKSTRQEVVFSQPNPMPAKPKYPRGRCPENNHLHADAQRAQDVHLRGFPFHPRRTLRVRKPTIPKHKEQRRHTAYAHNL
jgi:hypothetical protein